MFNVLITGDPTAWETDQLMRILAERLHDGYSGNEAKGISIAQPDSLKSLESIPTLLMYERGTKAPNADIVRYGQLREIKVAGHKLTFRFVEEGRVSRSVLDEFANRLGFGDYEQGRTHWAVKDGDMPTAMLEQLQPSYDVVFSFAGENRDYVEKVADCVKSKGVRVFYDRDEEANLWGKNLAEHFDLVYRVSGRYCVIFLSKHYAEKLWSGTNGSLLWRAHCKNGENIFCPHALIKLKCPASLPQQDIFGCQTRHPSNLQIGFWKSSERHDPLMPVVRTATGGLALALA
jgi:hypothetical protein